MVAGDLVNVSRRQRERFCKGFNWYADEVYRFRGNLISFCVEELVEFSYAHIPDGLMPVIGSVDIH